MSSLPTTSFVSRRVNPSTFVVSEDDDFGEQPYIYIKIYAKFIIVTDSGCNKPRNKDVQISSLRQYIEEYPISSNSNARLNPGGKKAYIIICSHCHYDHILGLPQFLSSNPTIIASELGKSFVLQDLPEHSLCKYLDIPAPKYDVSRWAGQFEYFSMSNTHFRIQFLQIPGHTPE
jgi:glyoxylase-like metal-dependent hydrolase (beta-lactamase superfamily II)